MARKNPFVLPARIPVSTIYLDESGSRNSSGGFFVVGFVKVRNQQLLERDIRHLRQKHQYFDEIHFADIKRSTLSFYFDLVETLAAADVRVGGSVYDSTTSFQADRETWEQQARMANEVNRSIGGRCVAEAYDINSEASDFVQLADAVASSIAYERRHGTMDEARKNSPKARVAARLRRALELDSFGDVQAGKVNIVTVQWT